MADAFKTRTMKRKNVKGLALSAPAPKTQPEPSAGDAQIPGAIGNSNNAQLDTLEIGVEFQLDLKKDDLVILRELGAGNGGTVSKVMHPATKIIMARKVIHVEAKEAVRKNIVRELHIMKDCSSPDIVTFYGAFLNDAGDVIMCMEYMDAGSLDRISKDFGPVRVDVLGKISVAVLSGLVYLYECHRIMHRDIKPSNVLVNSRGHIKLCDFGVSGELVNSIADTFVGTSTYMAPERIQGSKYTIKSDVWSMGLMIMELAIGRFPFDASETQGDREQGMGGILDLLQQIVHEPPPRLPKSSAFPQILDEMIQKCLSRNADSRPTPRELLDEDNFVQAAKRTPVDLEAWAIEMMQKANRKSHLQAPLSPATQALLRSEGPFSAVMPTPGPATAREQPPLTAKTPTSGASGEIPIAALAINDLPPSSSSSSNVPASATAAIPPSRATNGAYGQRDEWPGSYPVRTSSASAVPGVSVGVGGSSNGNGGIGGSRTTQRERDRDLPDPHRHGPPPPSASSSAIAGGGGYAHPTTSSIPFRPAPPPNGPLPHAPSSRGGSERRMMYPYGQEGQPI